MARPKKAIIASPSPSAPPPKHWRDVGHGCCSCTHYKLDAKAFPCRDCEGWNYWEDAKVSLIPSPSPS